jgi:hypothetical protein
MAPRRQIIAVASVVAIVGVMLTQTSTPVTAATTDVQLREGNCNRRGSFCHVEGRGARFGDQVTFNLLLRSRPDGARAGREYGQCVELNVAAASMYCDFVVELVDGSVAVQGRFSFAANGGTMPIVGGTGAYESAGGSWSQTGDLVDLHIVTP